MNERIDFIENTIIDNDGHYDNIYKLNKIHIAFHCDQQAKFRICVEQVTLLTESGSELSYYGSHIKNWERIETNATNLNLCFVTDGYELIDGAKFIIVVRDTMMDKAERYTYELQDEKWCLIKSEIKK